MKMYTCPMHPEVRQDKPGRCPKCGMNLVLDSVVNMTADQDHKMEKTTWKSYMPLLVIIGLLFITTLTLALKDLHIGTFTFSKTISYFMIGFFLTFAGFKLMDLQGFAQGYYTYDLLAKRWFAYGYMYPFLELFFGLAMILTSQAKWLLWTEFLVMAFSGLGVVLKLIKKEQFQCACLGTFLKVPLTKITLIEDFGMAALALILLLIR